MVKQGKTQTIISFKHSFELFEKPAHTCAYWEPLREPTFIRILPEESRAHCIFQFACK